MLLPLRRAVLVALCLGAMTAGCASVGANPTPEVAGYDSQVFEGRYDAVYQAALYAVKAEAFDISYSDEPSGVIRGRVEHATVLSDEHQWPMANPFPTPGRDALLPPVSIIDLECTVRELGPGVVEVDIEMQKNRDRLDDRHKYETLFKTIAGRLAAKPAVNSAQ
jgi:hypothetical protein